jgi:hypothetical protein
VCLAQTEHEDDLILRDEWGKGKPCPCACLTRHAVKAYGRNVRMAPRIRNLGEFHVPAALPPDNYNLYPLDMKVGSSPEQVWTLKNAPVGNQSTIRRLSNP